MARTFSIVPDGASGDDVVCSMADALRDVAAKIAADRPSVVMFVWEVPGKHAADDHELRMASLPGSFAVKKGLTLEAYDAIFPEEKGRAD
jgi:hypothetical protein